MLPDIIRNNLLVISILLAFIIILVTILWLRMKNRKKPKEKYVPFELSTLEQLVKALGSETNIEKIDMEHQRLKVIVKDIKKVSSIELKALNIPVFLKGKELTLLIKQQTKEVFDYIKTKIGA